MPLQIIDVDTDRNDDGLFTVTLRHVPCRMARWLGSSDRLVNYKGHYNAWYYADDYRRARKYETKLLNAIISSSEFRHLKLCGNK